MSEIPRQPVSLEQRRRARVILEVADDRDWRIRAISRRVREQHSGAYRSLRDRAKFGAQVASDTSCGHF